MTDERAEAQASAQAEETGPSITVLRGDPTAAELAAVTAVLAAMAQESADDASLESGTVSRAWQSGAGALRSPLSPGPGAWRSFSG